VLNWGNCLAADYPLLGTWCLPTFVREVGGTGERYSELVDHRDAYLIDGGRGRMPVLFVS
jgi:hypothetical protein